MTGKVFINYRKSLSRAHAEPLYAHLRDHLAVDRLFIDRRDLNGAAGAAGAGHHPPREAADPSGEVAKLKARIDRDILA